MPKQKDDSEKKLKKRARATDTAKKVAKRMKKSASALGTDMVNFLRKFWRMLRKTAGSAKAKHPVSGKGFLKKELIEPVEAELTKLFQNRRIKKPKETAKRIVNKLAASLQDPSTQTAPSAANDAANEVIEKTLNVIGNNGPESRAAAEEIRNEVLAKPEEPVAGVARSNSENSGDAGKRNRADSSSSETSRSVRATSQVQAEQPTTSEPATNVAVSMEDLSPEVKSKLEGLKPELQQQILQENKYLKMLKMGVPPQNIERQIKIDRNNAAADFSGVTLKPTEPNVRTGSTETLDPLLTDLQRKLAERQKKSVVDEAKYTVVGQRAADEPKSLPTAAAPRQQVVKEDPLEKAFKDALAKNFKDLAADSPFANMNIELKTKYLQMKRVGLSSEQIFHKYVNDHPGAAKPLQIQRGSGGQTNRESTGPAKPKSLVDEL